MSSLKTYKWESIGKYIELLSGFAFKSNKFLEEATQPNHVRLLRGINITEGAIRNNDNIDKFWANPSPELEKYLVKEGDLVISMDGSKVGRNYAVVSNKDIPSLLVQRVACIRAKTGLYLPYLHQIIGSKIFINYVDKVKTSSGIPHISAKQIKEFSIPLPSCLEQQKIAAVLSTVDDKIDVIDQKIAETQKLKIGLMQKLFSEGVGVQDNNGNWQPHTEFKDSSIGTLPTSWSVTHFKSVATIKSGKYDPKTSSENFPCVELDNLSQRTGEILGSVDANGLASTKNRFKKNNVLFGKLRPYLRKFANPNFEGVCSSEIWVLSPVEATVLNTKYLYYIVQSERFINEANKSCGTKMPRADWKVVSEMFTPIPPFSEQSRIANILDCIDKKLIIMKSQKAETRQLKKGLMQKLLTGEWRVPMDETEAA